MSERSSDQPVPSPRGFSVIGWCLPVALVALLTALYFLAPSFYLDYVLKEEIRETQIVERITFGAAIIAGFMLLWSAWRLKSPARGARLRGLAGAFIVGIIGLAAIFFAGEEVSWGQTWFGWKTPDRYQSVSPETNLHNNEWFVIRVQSLGSIFLIVMFFILPALWTQRKKLNLPPSLAPAVAEGPVVFSMAIAFLWKELKSVYLLFRPDASPDEPGLYGDFIDQFNEIKEMLVAVTLLMYACYRIRAVAIERARRAAESR